MPDNNAIFTDDRKQQVVFNDFRGGLNVDVAVDHLGANELATAINVDFSERGSIKKRRGTVKLNAKPYFDDVTQIFEWNRADGISTLFAVIGKELYEIDGEGNKYVKIADVASDRIGYFFLRDVMYFVDGESFKSYDGTQVKDVVVNDITFTVIPGEGNVSPGTYYCFVTQGGYPHQESVLSKVVQVVVSEPSAIQVTNIPLPSRSGGWRKYYRFPAEYLGRSEVSGEAAEDCLGVMISDPTASTFTDASYTKVSDGIFRIPDIASMAFDIPDAPQSKHVVRHTKSHRIFMAGDPSNMSALSFSEPNDPSIFKATSKMYPTTDDGEITGIATFVDAVVVFFRRSVWVWRGLDPEFDAVWQKIPVSDGTISPATITQITQGLVYLGSGGILGLSPAALSVSADIRLGSSYVLDFTANKVSNLIKSITNFDKAVAAYIPKEKKYLLAYCDDGSGVNNKILMLDETLGAFSIWEGINANDIYCRANGDVLIACKGYILKLDDESYVDIDVDTGDEVPIKFVAEIRSSFGAPLVRKLFTKVWTQVGGIGEEETLQYTIEVKVDNDTVLEQTVDVEPTNDEFVVANERFRTVGKQISIKVTHEESGKDFRLYGIGVDVTPVKSYGNKV